VIRGNSDGWSSALVLAGLIGGVVLLAAFLLWEARTAHPLLPLRLYRRRAFGAVNAASLLMSAGMFGSIFLLSQFLQIAEGYSPMTVGLRLLPWTGMPMIVAPIAGALSDRISGRTLIAVGLTLQAVSLGWLALLLGPHMSYAAQVPPFVLGGTGMALFFAPLANVLMSSVRPEEQGVASGANSAMREVGGALGVAVLTSVFTAHGDYTSARRFADGLVPAVWTGAAAITAAAVAILFVPVRRAPASGGADSSDQRPMLESTP